MPAVTAWSFSRWECHARCPLQFKLRFIDKVPEPQAPAMARGQKLHTGIAGYLTKAVDVLPAGIHANAVKTYDEFRQFDDVVVEQQWGFNREWKGTGWFGKDVWMRAILDAAVMYEDQTCEAIDHKSGKRYGENAEQVELFALAVMCKVPWVQHVTTRLVYVDSGEQDIAEHPASERDALIAKWEQKVVPMMTDTDFLPRPNDKCRFCHFSKSNAGLCRFG